MSTQDIVQKLWNLCNILRDDGITYHQYVTELTYILFLKMINETGMEEKLVKAVEADVKKPKFTAVNKDSKELTKKGFENLSYKKRLKLFLENPALYKELQER